MMEEKKTVKKYACDINNKKILNSHSQSEEANCTNLCISMKGIFTAAENNSVKIISHILNSQQETEMDELDKYIMNT